MRSTIGLLTLSAIAAAEPHAKAICIYNDTGYTLSWYFGDLNDIQGTKSYTNMYKPKET